MYARFKPSVGVEAGYPQNITHYWYGVSGKHGCYLKNTHIQAILTKQLKGKLATGNGIYLADAVYFCPTVKAAKSIIAKSLLDQQVWIEERFDCDDFAYLLKAEFVKDAYRQGERRSAHCFGIVWGKLPTPHAINWMINDDLKLRFVEPQNDKIFAPRPNDKEIRLLLS